VTVCGGDGYYDHCGVDRSRRNYWVSARVGLWTRRTSLCAGRLHASLCACCCRRGSVELLTQPVGWLWPCCCAVMVCKPDRPVDGLLQP